MNLLSAENVTKRYGEHLLFEHVSFGIQRGQKTALVAKNGTGKSSLLRIIAGLEAPDSGNVVVRNGISIGYLEQAPHIDPSKTVLNNILSSDDPKLKYLAQYEKAVAADDSATIEKMIPEMDRLKLWDAESRVKQILGVLAISDIQRTAENLSGGEQKRVALAKLIFTEPDLVILDEPTNHLDLDMVEYLEEYLSGSSQGLLMVTHDRYFLENVCGNIIELDDRQLYTYDGSFSYYLAKKAERKAGEETSVNKAQNLYRKELDWIRRQPKARGTKSKSRVEAFQQVKDDASKKLGDKSISIDFRSERLGNKIVELHNVGKSYGELKLFEGFTYKFLRGENVGVAGKNGAGKTTLVNIILGKEKPDTGKVVVGETVRIGHYDQRGLQLKKDKRVLDVLRDIAEEIEEADGKTVDAARLLEKFLFSRKEQQKWVSTLSGGEKRRLYLVTVLMFNPNFLILDEPTNDLDILTLSILEEYLNAFDGCVLLVTHDRYLLDKVADHTLIFQGDSKIKDFVGKYSEYRQHQKAPAGKKDPKPGKVKVQRQKTEQPKMRLSYKEKLEFEQLDNEIPALEEEKESLNIKMMSGKLDNEKMQEHSARLSMLIEEIDKKTLRWMKLAEYYNG